MVEMLAAMVVFAILATAVAMTLNQSLDLTRTNRDRVVAANLAARQIEVARNLDVKVIPNGLTEYQQVVDNQTYTVRQTATYVPLNTAQSTCASAAGTRLVAKRVSVEVTWPRMSNVKPVRSDTLKALETTTLDPTKGSISALVVGRDGAPMAGIPVTLNPGGVMQLTGSDGCVIYPELSTAGTYSLTVNVGAVCTASNCWMDPLGVLAPTQGGITVQASQNSPRTFEYDRAASLDVTFAAPAGYGTFPTFNTGGTGTFGITAHDANTSRAGATTRRLPDCAQGGATCLSGPRAVNFVYPSAQGYRAYAGTCADVLTTAGNPAPHALQPGARSSGVLPTGGIAVVGGGPTSPLPIYAIHAADAGCPGGEVWFLGYSYGTPITAALPFGSWRLWSSPSPGVNAPSVTLSDASPTGGTSPAAPVAVA